MQHNAEVGLFTKPSRLDQGINMDTSADKKPPAPKIGELLIKDGLVKKEDVDLRIAICPAIVGENITIRILDSRTAKVGLENLGHSSHVLNPFKTLLKSPAGMVLVTGPTGK